MSKKNHNLRRSSAEERPALTRDVAGSNPAGAADATGEQQPGELVSALNPPGLVEWIPPKTQPEGSVPFEGSVLQGLLPRDETFAASLAELDPPSDAEPTGLPPEPVADTERPLQPGERVDNWRALLRYVHGNPPLIQLEPSSFAASIRGLRIPPEFVLGEDSRERGWWIRKSVDAKPFLIHWHSIAWLEEQ